MAQRKSGGKRAKGARPRSTVPQRKKQSQAWTKRHCPEFLRNRGRPTPAAKAKVAEGVEEAASRLRLELQQREEEASRNRWWRLRESIPAFKNCPYCGQRVSQNCLYCTHCHCYLP